jgi:hypothetical protein
VILLGLTSCTHSHDVDEGAFPVRDLPDGDTGKPEPAAPLGSCAKQADEYQDRMPVDLNCTGLYSDSKTKTISKGVESYEPGFKLWSDGAEKYRYIQLPEGETIDTSNPKGWKFPKDTKIWKEFRAADQRAETRLYWKDRDDHWVKTTYTWNDDSTKALREDNGMVMPVNGVNYEVPNVGTCDDCHDGARDNALGFEPISLGVPETNQDGLTLRKLVDRGLLSDPPEMTAYEIGDDGTGKAREVFGWLHANCGNTCHNDGVNSKAKETDLRMKLDPTELDGRSLKETAMWKNIVGVPAKTVQWQGQLRVTPGKPDESLLYKLITTRLGVDGNKQMPPLVTRRVDEEHAEMVREWILALEPIEGATSPD